MQFVLTLPVDDFFRLIAKAKTEVNRQLAWDMWIAKLPYMGKDSYTPFEDFYTELKQQSTAQSQYSRRPAEDILAEADAIKAAIDRS